MGGEFDRAYALHMQGRFEDAFALYQSVLSRNPLHFDALHLSGVIAAQTGDLLRAAELIKRALEIDPRHINALNNLGYVFRGLGRMESAIEMHDRALLLEPAHADHWYNRALALHDLARFEEAVGSFRKALSLKPDFADAWNMLGATLNALKSHEAALECYERSIALNPSTPAAHNNRGVALNDLERFAEGLRSCEQALALHAGDVTAWNNRAISLMGLDRHEEALASCMKAIELDQGSAEAWTLLGVALNNLKRYGEAIEAHDRALRLKPGNAKVYNNLSVALNGLNRFPEALSSCTKAIALNPDYSGAYINSGNALNGLGRYNEAIACYSRALEKEPDCIDARWNIGFNQLLVGNFREGWQNYEWRWKKREMKGNVREFARPEWNGKDSLDGRTILLYSEQGLGDTIQFCRYAGVVRDMGATVTLQVQDALEVLLAGTLEGVTIISEDAEVPPCDFHLSLMSLPGVFNTVEQTIPADKNGYINADQIKVKKWQEVLGPRSIPRVGIVWSGSLTHGNDHNRSIPLSEFVSLLPEGFEYISLQKEVRESDREVLREHPGIVHFGEQLADFADTAALCELVDLVVSVDTSVAHLAGAMGRPVWILLPFNPDWRWLLKRDDSPWYPTARLFRQESPGEWERVMIAVREELLKRFSGC